MTFLLQTFFVTQKTSHVTQLSHTCTSMRNLLQNFFCNAKNPKFISVRHVYLKIWGKYVIRKQVWGFLCHKK